jgi:hypothetical protein
MVQYFIDIQQQDRFRIEILTVQKHILDCLKRCEVFKQVREDKLKEIENLRKILKELGALGLELRSKMPKVNIKGMEKEFKRTEAPASFYDYNKELEKLESSIKDIENKLKEMQ